MKQIIALMEKGESRTNAARAVGIPIFTANTWFIKGKNGNPMYKEFYLNVLRVWESNKS